MKSWNVTRLNIPVMHSLKLCMEKTGMTESGSQGPGLVRKQIIKTLIWRRIINNVVLPSAISISVILTIIRSESRSTKIRQDKKD